MNRVNPEATKGNRNHHICEVNDTTNQAGSEIYSVYFDGTQAEAIEHFIAHKKLQAYAREGYRIVMSTNSIVLHEIAPGEKR